VDNWKIHPQYASSHVIITLRCFAILQSWSALMTLRKLSRTLNRSRTWSSSFLPCKLTWLQTSQFFMWGYSKTEFYAITVYTRQETLYLIQTNWKWNIKYIRNLRKLEILFFTQSRVQCPWIWGPLEAPTCNSSFLFMFLTLHGYLPLSSCLLLVLLPLLVVERLYLGR
jgi:hypothetical protein